MTAWSKMIFLGILTVMFLILAVIEIFSVQDPEYPTKNVVYSLLGIALFCFVCSISYHHILFTAT